MFAKSEIEINIKSKKKIGLLNNEKLELIIHHCIHHIKFKRLKTIKICCISKNFKKKDIKNINQYIIKNKMCNKICVYFC